MSPGGGGQLGFEWVTDYRRPLEHAPCADREKCELLGQRARNRRRHVEIPGRELSNACGVLKGERSGELLEIERVAAAFLIESGCGVVIDRFTEELSSLVARQGANIDAQQCPRAVRSLERAGEALGRVTRSDGQRDEYRRCRRPAQQRTEQLYRSDVSPVEIVEHEHQRPARRQSLEQLAHRPVSAIALVLERCLSGRREPSERGKDERQLGTNIIVECLEATRLKPRDVLVERVHEHPEGQVALKLRCRPGEDELPPRVSASRKLDEQTGLADPGLTDQHERSRPPAVELGEGIVDHAARLCAPYKLLAYGDHCRSWRA